MPFISGYEIHSSKQTTFVPLVRDQQGWLGHYSTPLILRDIQRNFPLASTIVLAVLYLQPQNSRDNLRPECRHFRQCAKRESEPKLLSPPTTRSLLPPCGM